MWETDPLFLTALGTWVLVVGTIVLMWWQTRQQRELNSATAVMELRERFDSPPLRRARKHLATRLLNNQHDDITNLEVGAFFELVGTLTHRRVLDEDLVWEAFGNWITAYFWKLRHPVDMIARGREAFGDPLIFHEFEWLQDSVLSVDRHRTGALRPAPEVRDREGDIMMRREADLDLS
jgi:hypothetical protein